METHANEARLASEEKGDVPIKRSSRIWGKERQAFWGCASLLLNMHKNECQRIILHAVFYAPAHDMVVCTCARTCANGHAACRIMKHGVEHKLFEIFEAF
jgi:hypothetical protein